MSVLSTALDAALSGRRCRRLCAGHCWGEDDNPHGQHCTCCPTSNAHAVSELIHPRADSAGGTRRPPGSVDEACGCGSRVRTHVERPTQEPGGRVVETTTVRPMSEPTQPEKDTWHQGTGLCIGLALGAVLGLSVFDNTGLGMAIGVASGLVVDAIARGRRREPEAGDPDSSER